MKEKRNRSLEHPLAEAAGFPRPAEQSPARTRRSASKRSTASRKQTAIPAHATEKTVGTSLRETYRAFARDLSRRLQAHGITLFMWFVLRELWKRDGLSQIEIARATDRQASAIVGVVRALKKGGLVQVSRSKADGRVSVVRLTEAGRELEPILTEHSKQLNQTALRGFPLTEQRQLMIMLERLRRNIALNNGWER